MQEEWRLQANCGGRSFTSFGKSYLLCTCKITFARSFFAIWTNWCGNKGGMEAAIHTLQTFIEENGNNEDLCCVKVDMANAFNNCDRSIFLNRLHKEMPDLLLWVQRCYTSAGELRFGSHRILSIAGVQQGDPLSLLLFFGHTATLG